MVNETLNKAQLAFNEWKNESAKYRAGILNKIADIYEERSQEVARAMAKDMGKPVKQAEAEVSSCVAIYRFYANNYETLLQADSIPSDAEAKVVLEPTGVLLGVMPWNYPHYQLARFVAPNILLGNAIVFKHARICGRSAALVQEIIEQAGSPAGLVINSNFSHDQVFAAIADEVITGVSFTGGEKAGAAIAAAAGKNLKKVVLELGGNDPFIVFDETKTAELAELIAKQRIWNAGQTCVSPKRIIVKESIFADFLKTFKEQFLKFAPADPLKESTLLGPLSSAQAAGELKQLLDDNKTAGTQIIGEHTRSGEPEEFFHPVIVVSPDRDSELWRTELFGPVAVLCSAKNVTEAITLANDSSYGLGATVFSDNTADEQVFALKLAAGMVAINRLKGADPALPFGGIKNSGFGRELGSYGVREFANLKLITHKTH